MKQILFYLVFIVPMAFFTACSKDEDNQNERPTNEVKNDDSNGDDKNDGSGNDGYVGDHVIVNDDGTTSNGSLFSAIDNTNFYLDYVKYSVVEGHLEVSGYDKVGFQGEAKIVSKITYKGNTFEVLAIRGAFSGCGVLTSIKIPNCVTSIGEYAFLGCSGLISIKIPNSVKSIGYQAFYGCTGLTSITIPNSVKDIGSSAFRGCTGLTSITIPNSVTSIEICAFYGCSGLTSVTIGNSVTSIGNSAFSGCNLKKVIVSDIAAWCGISFSSDESNPLYYAHNLYSDENTKITDLIIPNSVTSIGDFAFSSCSGLTSVTIGNSVKSIGYSAFSGCSGLTTITSLNTTPPTIDYYTFPSYNATLKVPTGSRSAYKTAAYWRNFRTIVEIDPSGV